MNRAATLMCLASLGACGNFENPEVILDFRLLGISATPPEQVIDVDIQNPPSPVELLEQVEPTEICVLLSDRQFDRRLRWEMSICVLNNAERCSGGAPIHKFASGFWDDPEQSPMSPQQCATIQPDGNLLAIALASLEEDQLRGLGGIYYGLSLRVGGENDAPEIDLYGAKDLRLMPRIPAEVEANTNPTLDHLDVTLPDGEPMVLAFGRCIDQLAPLEVAPATRIRIDPIEPEGAREPYVVPTTDGMSRMFTESLTYQWLATAGNYSSSNTGGTRDAFGNPAPLFTHWASPAAKDLDGITDVDLWVIQRDERLGLRWYESCIRVVP